MASRHRRPARRPVGAPGEALPDVRDGLNRLERVVLATLAQLQRERGPGRSVPVIELWGRVVEQVDVSQAELLALLGRLGAAKR